MDTAKDSALIDEMNFEFSLHAFISCEKLAT